MLYSDGGKPWVKHEPSPGASPSTSILKKPIQDDICKYYDVQNVSAKGSKACYLRFHD